jgi:hypothetical protein
MKNEVGNGDGDEPNLLTELFLQLWSEQYEKARGLVLTTFKERKEGARQRCEGALFMLEALREQYTNLPFGGLLRERLASDCQAVRNLIEQF